jgi:RHS repeat-associated protein
MPYGEEIVGLGNRTSADKYVADDVRQGFTGYIKDDETGLDFAQARMYKKELGRFTGVDSGAFTPADPQNFNRYIYVQNNPLKFLDPTGNDLELKGDDAEYIKSQLEEYTGYKLNLKKGKLTIDTSIKRNEKGTSKKLADLITKITDKNYKANVVLNLTSKTGDNDKIFLDDFNKKTLDVNDFKTVKKASNELAGTLLSHVIKEYDYAATEVGENTLRDAGVSDIQYQFKLSHPEGKQFEAQVLSELTGKDQGDSRGEPREAKTSTKQTFVYKSIEYDIQRKSSQGNKGYNEVTGVIARPK